MDQEFSPHHRLRLPLEDQFCDPMAHMKCNFGRWYQEQTPSLFPDDELFLQIGQAHQTFHHLATEILDTAREQRIIEEGKYDLFMSVVVVFNDMLRRLQSELWGKISSSDPLTGLKSWHRLLSPVGSTDTRMPKEKTACTAMCDIDHFKVVNDTHGHQTGDEVLR